MIDRIVGDLMMGANQQVALLLDLPITELFWAHKIAVEYQAREGGQSSPGPQESDQERDSRLVREMFSKAGLPINTAEAA